MAPEYMMKGQLSKKADILAFGVCTRNHYKEREYRFITKVGIKATFFICKLIKWLFIRASISFCWSHIEQYVLVLEHQVTSFGAVSR